eukprot:CAMPEP_0172498136 /NCGR_PEP_ID=MMETSP1066-20121228/109754_1 /TAXON_ID=671091 /ORGANISM="Coscinodiscus wailesii, Strain CCMP2513" /LENGTH=537 /DNA_ID=CAMNT_0013271291 /DNA_START=144 /DNA_END=1757 /DNA_ORIENTATION=+
MPLTKEMSSKRRLNIELMAQRQVEKEKRSRLESVLIQKLTMKIGSEQAYSLGLQTTKRVPKKIVVTAVKSFLDEKGTSILHETDIRKVDPLVDIISDRLQKIPPSSYNKKTLKQQRPSANDDNTTTNRPNTTHDKNNEPMSTQQSNTASQPKIDPIISNTNPWALLEAFKAVETDSIKIAEKEKAVADRQKCITALNNQIRSKELVKKSQKKYDDDYVAEQARQLSEWQKSQKRVAESERQKCLALKEIRRQQIESRRQKQKLLKDELHRRELDDIAYCASQLQKEEDLKRRKREAEIERLESIRVENIQRQRLRDDAKRDEADADAKLMRDAKARLDAAEARRVAALRDRMTRCEVTERVLSESVLAGRRRERKLEEERLEKVQRARRREEEEREEEKKRMLQIKKREIMTSNNAMMEERRKRDVAQERADQEYSIQCCAERDAVLAEETLKKRMKMEAKKEYCKLLKEQIDEQKSNQENYLNSMTSVEKSINRTVMKKIEDDPALQQKVINKIVKKTPNNRVLFTLDNDGNDNDH